MSGLTWLNDLMVWLARWVPRLTLIRSTHVGVLFGPRGRVRLVPASLFCYWPITHELQLVAMRERSLELAAQLHAGDAVSIVIGWRVVDAVKAATSLTDAEAYLDDRAQSALSAFYSSSRESREICAEMLTRLRGEFAGRGIDVQWVDVAQRSWVLPLKNLNDYATHHGKGEAL